MVTNFIGGSMPELTDDWQPGETAQQLNESRYGDPNPWVCVDERAVYEMVATTELGYEVRFTSVKTYKHDYTDDTRDWVRPWGECEFVFHDEWPDDDIIRDGMVSYRPLSAVSVDN